MRVTVGSSPLYVRKSCLIIQLLTLLQLRCIMACDIARRMVRQHKFRPRLGAHVARDGRVIKGRRFDACGREFRGREKTWVQPPFKKIFRSNDSRLCKKLSYRKQIERQLRTQYVDVIYSNSVTLKSRSQVTQGHWNWTIRKLGFGFLFAFYTNYCAILHRLRDSELFVENENREIFIPHLYLAPPRG